jgi:hypothetical protein
VVKAKSRHRDGVINQPGEFAAEDPRRSNRRGLRSLLKKAMEKETDGLPFSSSSTSMRPPRTSSRRRAETADRREASSASRGSGSQAGDTRDTSADAIVLKQAQIEPESARFRWGLGHVANSMAKDG